MKKAPSSCRTFATLTAFHLALLGSAVALAVAGSAVGEARWLLAALLLFAASAVGAYAEARYKTGRSCVKDAAAGEKTG